MSRWHPLPAELYALVEQTPATVLLESANPGATCAQPDFPASRLFTAPLRICVANRLSEIPTLFAEIERAVASGLYAAGYFTYECGAFFEPAATDISQPSGQPLAWFGIYQRPHVFDHQSGTFVEGDPPQLAGFHAPVLKPTEDQPLASTLATSEQQYTQTITAIHELIRSGDVYQLNFTVPIQVEAHGSSAALYRHLRGLQPAPYGAFLHTQTSHRILSFSPELFFRLENHGEIRRITTRPMKGTAPRGRTTAEDRTLANWLQNDPKNRSENVMIVDLLRNDLGRICTFGSVHASPLFAVERYPTLWQMTSTITGDLRPEVGFQDLFRALFPCGSVTGAPKIRAMRLIAQLEGRPRGVYTGAIGFFSKKESIFNVAIRTLVLERISGSMGVGSGIVIDSNAAEEFRECQLKASFITNSALAHFSLVETLLWNGDFPLIDLHLDRIEDSAYYFAFPFDSAQTKAAALEAHAATISQKLRAPSIPRPLAEWVGDHEPHPTRSPANSPTRHSRQAGANSLIQSHKVRLLLNPDGSLQITSEPIPALTTQPLRVRISPDRTDPSNPMYFHKTTHRPLYAEALNAAIEAGYDEVLFLNQRGEVTEAANHNFFIEKDGRLITPPFDCGLLPGVYRRHILETHPTVVERTLTLEDLRQAEAVYLCNAVRGLRKAIIDWECR
jgi:para-aminobenzoate synthetase/4-amino-4-deoxychorismate lyase